MVPGDGAVNAGCVDPLLVLLVKLEALYGAPGTPPLDHRLEQSLLRLSILLLVLVGVPEDYIPSLIYILIQSQIYLLVRSARLCFYIIYL